MSIFKEGPWINNELWKTKEVGEVTDSTLEEIKARVCNAVSDDPKVSVVIPAYNEEMNVVRCIDSLSRTVSTVPFEIVVVNNNSNDRTQEMLEKMGVRHCFQGVQGWGPARQMGLEHAKGKYVLTADSDCLYPPTWVQTMYNTLSKQGVVCAYGPYAYMSEGHRRVEYWLYERMTDLMRIMRHFRRPYLNCYGMNMGYRKEEALKVGYVDKKIIGEDGRICHDLMEYGKIKIVLSKKARLYTSPRAIFRNDTSIYKALLSRLVREVSRLDQYFSKSKPHDTKTSLNGSQTMDEHLQVLKGKLGKSKAKAQPSEQA